MANSSLVAWASVANAVSDNTTEYSSLSGNNSGTTTENQREIPVRNAGTFSNLYVYATANTTLVTTTVTLRKSTVDTSVTLSYASSETGIKEDTTNSASFANTDEGGIEVTVPNDVSGSTTFSYIITGVQFAPDDTTKCAVTLAAVSFDAVTTASTTTYYPLNGSCADDAVEANSKYRARASFTFSNLFAYVSANLRSNNTTIRVRVNGADGSQNIVYGSSQTGVKEDTSNTDSVSVGDDINYSLTTGLGTNQLSLHLISSVCVNTSNIFPLLAATAVGESVNFNVTSYTSVSGFLAETSTEANTQYRPRFDFTAKELIAYVEANTIATSASTLTLRDGGADSSVTVSYAAAETGLKNDTSNSTTITSGTDQINLKYSTPNTSGALTFNVAGILGETAAAATDYAPRVMMM